MPSVLSKDLTSKILGSEWSFGYNCYEVGHTWTPSCTGAALEISLAAALKIMPLYAMLYSFSQLAVQRRYSLEASWESTKSTLRSTFFIFFHAYNGSLMGCALRHGFGRFYYRVLVCAPALLSSYLALVIEKPVRRQALAFYLLNLASETVYRMVVAKGYFRPVRNGETLLFALSLAAWYHLIKQHGFGRDPVSAAVKVLIGRDEAKSRSSLPIPSADGRVRDTQNPPGVEEADAHQVEADQAGGLGRQTDGKWRNSQLALLLARADETLDRVCRLWLGGRHSTCTHAQSSCFRYVFGPAASRFLLGWAIQCVLGLSRRPMELIADPKTAVRTAIGSRASLRFGLFLASLVSGGRLASCLLRRLSNSNTCTWHPPVAGFVAGLSMAWAPRSSLSLYVMWKAVEQYYLQAAKSGGVKYFDFTILTIYAASAATILYTFALEPRFVRPSYMKFLDNLSDHRLHQLNRMVLDVFGTGSSVGYEDYFPDLDPKLMSNQFKELVFNWMIQVHE